MVIGGAQLYAALLPRAGRVHLTRVHAAIDGDTRFPDLDPREWREVAREERAADARNAYALSFITFERK
jgi:dihydrofolate reductase